MARRLPGLCTHGGGCAAVTPPGRDRCAAHPRGRAPDRRPSPSRRGYDAAWRRVRAAFLAAHPVCAWCGRRATQVDHVVELRRGGSHEWSNLRALCARCHSRRTARRPGSFGRG